MKKAFQSRSPEKMLSADSTAGSLWTHRAVVAATLVLPFIVLYWLTPFISKYTIGNDYLTYWIRDQLYLQFSAQNGTFPLYAPGFSGGWTTGAMMFGQLWHPISWLAAQLPGYWNGHAREIGTLLRLLSLGGTHLILLLFLRRLRLTTMAAFVISFVTVYNLRMLDMFRYGPSLECYVAYLLLCVAVMWHYITPTKRIGLLCIAIATWLLIVAGHPQMMYIGLLGAAFVCLVTPFYVPNLLQKEPNPKRPKIWKYYLTVVLAVAAGIFLASAYILPFAFEYFPDTARSINPSFKWACGHQDTVVGNLCNLFNPFHSDVHSAFGGSVLILLAALMPLLLLLRIRIPLPVLLVWLMGIATFLLVLGSNGLLYYCLWKYFPLVQSFRVPGRFGMLLPFIILMLLAWMVRLEPVRFRIRARDFHLAPLVMPAAVTVLLLIALNCIPADTIAGFHERFPPMKLHNIPTVVVALTVISAVVSLLALILYGMLNRSKWLPAAVFILASLLQVTTTLRYGTWVASNPGKTPTFQKMRAQQQKHFAFPHHSGDNSRVLLKQHLWQTFLEPVLLGRVCYKYTIVTSRAQAYKLLAQQRSVDRVLVENYHPTRTQTETAASDTAAPDGVKLEYNSFNNLIFEVKTGKPGFFVFPFPYSKFWRAYISGQRVPSYRADGIEQAVRIPAGKTTVEFRYLSWPALTGAAVSFLTLLAMVIHLLTALRPGPLRLSTIIAASCICTLTLVIWYHSLYKGGNIGTKYNWNSGDITPNRSSRYNLAYGKTTDISSMRNNDFYFYGSPRGVDGERAPDRGFCTQDQGRPWWKIDLGRVEPITEIILFRHYIGIGKKEYHLPFKVLVSNDDQDWRPLGTVTGKGKDDYWHIRLQNVTAARYVALRAEDFGYLALSEVEIYGPRKPDPNNTP